MTINQINYFLATADMLNMTKVAEKYHVSQPAVSMAIRELEDEFDVKLFSRNKNGICLTTEGLSFYYKATEFINHYHSLLSGIKIIDTQKKPCRIGISRVIAATFLAELYKFIKNVDKAFLLSFDEDSVSSIIRSVQNGFLDCALVSKKPSKDDGLYSDRLISFRLDFCIHKQLWYRDSNEISLSDTQKLPIALFMKSSTHNQLIKKKYASLNLTPDIQFEMSQVHTITLLIKEEIAGGFLPGIVFKDEPMVKCYKVTELSDSNVYFIYKDNSDMIKKLRRILKNFS